MTKARLSQIGFSAAGLLGGLMLLAGNAHAEASVVTTNQSSSVSVTTESTQTTSSSDSETNSVTTSVADQPGVFINQQASQSNPDGDTAASQANQSTSQAAVSDVGTTAQTDQSAEAVISQLTNHPTSTNISGQSDGAITLATGDGGHYSVRKVTKQSQGQVTQPAQAATTTNSADPQPLPALPQTNLIFSDSHATVPPLGRGGWGDLPKIVSHLWMAVPISLLLVVAVAWLFVVATYLRDLVRSGYSRASRGSTTNIFTFAFPTNGLSMGFGPVRNPFFDTYRRQMALEVMEKK